MTTQRLFRLARLASSPQPGFPFRMHPLLHAFVGLVFASWALFEIATGHASLGSDMLIGPAGAFAVLFHLSLGVFLVVYATIANRTLVRRAVISFEIFVATFGMGCLTLALLGS